MNPAAAQSQAPLQRDDVAVNPPVHALSADDVAHLLGCEPQHVNALAAAHAIPAVKFGRSWRFPAHALNVFLNQQAMAHLTKETPSTTAASISRTSSTRHGRPDLSQTVKVA